MAKLCPECDSPLDIDVDEVDEGETVTCEECGAEVEIVSVEPLEIALVDAEGYDDEVGLAHEDEEDEDA